MHKKLQSELISLAHQILQMKDKDDVIKLRDKAAIIHEKLAVLVFVDNYFLITPNASENKEELQTIVTSINNPKMAIPEKEVVVKESVIEESKTLKKEEPKISVEIENEKVLPEKEVVVKETITEEPKTAKEAEPKISVEIEKQNEETIKTEVQEIVNKIIEQEVVPFKDDIKDVTPPIKENSFANNEEFKDSIPADVAANLFEKAEKFAQPQKQEKTIVEEVKKVEVEPIKTEPKQETKTSLNDRIFSQKIQVGLNDRIAFVKHLFNFSQEDFNRVLSQLNTFNTETESKHFINTQVKPEYNWSDKEEYEERLITLIERKFL